MPRELDGGVSKGYSFLFHKTQNRDKPETTGGAIHYSRV